MNEPQHDARLEFRVLGLALLDEQAHAAVAALPEEVWHDADNATIAAALRALHKAGKVADVAEVERELHARSAFQSVGGHAVLVRLVSTAGSIVSLDQHVATLREFAQARRVALAAAAIAAAACRLRGDALSAFVAREMDGATLVHGAAGPADLNTVIQEAFARIEALATGAASGGLSLGFPSLDRIMNPLQGGQFIIVAARPACGKSAFMQALAINAARCEVPALVLSLEMQRTEIGMRILASGSGVNLSHMSRGAITAEGWNAIARASQAAGKLPIFVEDDPTVTVPRLLEMAGRIKRTHGNCVVFVDYAQLMKSDVRSDSREREVAEVSRGLKRLAKQLSVPVIALAQFNRDSVKGGTQRTPTIADLRESGQLEQDADAIILMHRPSTNGTERGDRVEFNVAKQRSGPTGATWLAFDGATVTFSDDGADNGMPPEQGNPAAASGVHRKQTGYQQRTAGAAVVQPDDDEFPAYVHGSEGFDAAE